MHFFLRLTVFLVGILACRLVQPNDDESFQQVSKILQSKCLSCHNDNDRKGELSLQSLDGLNRGGETGKVVTPGRPSESSLLDYVSGEEPEMPLDQPPLSKLEIASIQKWIKEGAVWPKSVVLKTPLADRDWWSLKPLKRVSIPKGVENPIDHFVQIKHQQKGIGFSKKADRRTLIRRVYFDLIGLPPSPDEIKSFCESKDPKAYEKLVDQLLASPHYGERWARHWLDVVQFGETHGYDKDKLRPNAWPYRDYVIRSLNNDTKYSQFVLEQLAGDVLQPRTPDGIIATGFIAAGPWDFIGHAEVPETKLDGKVARNLDRDNMVTSTMNTFCSLTIQCARCHDHKLDPVSMEEYYSLQAVFASIDRADRPYDRDPLVAARRADIQSRIAKTQALINQYNREIETRKSDELKHLEKRINQLTESQKSGFPNPTVARSNRYGYHSQVAKSSREVKWVQIDLGVSKQIDQLVLIGADEYGWKDFGFPDRFVVEVSDQEDFRESRIIVDHSDRNFPRPGGRPVVLNFDSTRARYVRLKAIKLWSRRHRGQPLGNDWIFAMGEMSAVSNGRFVAIQNVSAKDSIEAMPRWGRANLIDGILGDVDGESKLGIRESPTNGFHSLFAKNPDFVKWIMLDLKEERRIDEIEILPAYPTDFTDTPGFGFPLRFKIELSNNRDFKNSQTVFDQTASDYAQPGSGAFRLNINPDQSFRFVRFTATKLWDRGDQNHALALGEFRVLGGDKNFALGSSVSASDSIDSGRWHRNHLIDGYTSRLKADGLLDHLSRLAGRPEKDLDLEKLTRTRDSMLIKQVGQQLPLFLQNQKSEKARLESELSNLPPASRVYAGTIHQGSGTFRGRGGLGPREIRVLHRGNVSQPGKLVAPGTVSFVPGFEDPFQFRDAESDGERRLALAKWITHQENPLTWRSIVNRVWHYHFGKGIVDTPNDFGRGGSKPTHPELLDWLAGEFRDGGRYLAPQSIKALHRLILTSQTYQQTSLTNAHSKIDSGNRFLWRMNRRRLSAEEIRDSVLWAAGKLNLKMGGPSFMDFVIERPEHSPHYEYDKYNPLDPKTHRRAIYRFIVRSQPQPFMDTLNCADPSFSVPRRSETLTALQALAMLNNRFMVAMSSQFAKRIKGEADNPTGQIRIAFQLVTGRYPTGKELQVISSYHQKHGLENSCRILFNLSEFVFVD